MSAEAALQEAIYVALRDDPEVSAFVNGRIYDRVPLGATRPYIHLADMAATAVPGECTDSLEIFHNVDIWSESRTKIEATQIAREVSEVLHEQTFPLDVPFSLIDLRRISQSTSEEGEGLYRCRIVLKAIIDRLD
jgi:hypothetical protein